MNQIKPFAFIPTFPAINCITEVNGTEINSGIRQAYYYIVDTIMMVGKGNGAQFTHKHLAESTGVTLKTARVTVNKLVELGLIGTCKGTGRTHAYFLITPPYKFPGVSEEDAKGIKEAWDAIYYTDEFGKNIN